MYDSCIYYSGSDYSLFMCMTDVFTNWFKLQLVYVPNIYDSSSNYNSFFCITLFTQWFSLLLLYISYNT
jgi:hypothetical protein